MSAIHPARNTQPAYTAAEAEQEHLESQKSSPKPTKSAENAGLNRKPSNNGKYISIHTPQVSRSEWQGGNSFSR